MITTGIILKNNYIVKAMPKTKGKGFNTIKVGDIIEISLELTHCRSGDNRNLRAYYPKINGIECAGITYIKSLIDKGLVLEEVNI